MGTIVRIKIKSILGGHAKTLYSAAEDEFQTSLGINPGKSATQFNSGNNIGVSGILRPTGVRDISGGIIARAPMWLIKNPKGSQGTNPIFIYCANGSVFTTAPGSFSVTALSDTGLMSSASGNGAAYYDNYIYFAKDADVARYGPLNGAPTFNGSYWQGTLGFSALNSNSYPGPYSLTAAVMPNHVMHRHSDGKLYFADVQNNQGVIHMISTSKTTVEGDTNAASKQSALTFGYGLWPTAIESYGSQLVVALYETAASAISPGSMPAKIAFWDTTSGAFNQITWDEFPDSFISAIKNINGILYFISNAGGTAHGVRVSRYIGGYSFEEVAFIEDGSFPYPGAVTGNTNQIVFGGNNSQISGNSFGSSCVWSVGLNKHIAPNKIFNLSRAVGDTITSLVFNQTDANNQSFVVGWTTFAGSNTINGIDVEGSTNSGTDQSPIWWSQRYQIGQRFNVRQITVPLVNQLSASNGQDIVPTLWFDNKHHSVVLPNINRALMDAQGATNLAVLKVPSGQAYGETEFWLELAWTSSITAPNSAVKMPITIDVELIDS